MIPVAELDNIARARIEDAKALLTVGRFDGATYLCGYAIEVALKARICKTLSWPEFPSTGGEFQAYRSFQTHDLDVLLRLSGQEGRIKRNHFALWNPVAIWKVESRYNVVGTVQQPEATAMIEAAGELLAVL
ncbi:MAG: HEPN domain-containing protein [Betaproteobacteria bacterium]|nr:HEPN domain-containing protein [Betaproteobacteria bacterium]